MTAMLPVVRAAISAVVIQPGWTLFRAAACVVVSAAMAAVERAWSSAVVNCEILLVDNAGIAVAEIAASCAVVMPESCARLKAAILSEVRPDTPDVDRALTCAVVRTVVSVVVNAAV